MHPGKYTLPSLKGQEWPPLEASRASISLAVSGEEARVRSHTPHMAAPGIGMCVYVVVGIGTVEKRRGKRRGESALSLWEHLG